MKRRRGALLALVLVLGLGAALPAAAAPAPQPAGLTMTVQPAYGGYYKLGEWFPIQVTLSNTGATFDGEVQVDAIGTGSDAVVATYSRPVSLPAPARKQITLYTYAASYQHALAVRLVQGGRTVLQQQATLNPLNDAFLLGVVSDQPDLLNALSGTAQGAAGNAQPVTVAHLAPADLPESATALADLDALVVAGTDTSRLTAAARQALGGWVAGGGLLVVAGGTTGSATAAGLADLLPATVGDPGSAADLAALGTFAKAAAPPSSGVPVSALQPIAARGATVLAGTAAQPLIVQRALGSGAVVVLAVDPGQPPFPGWSGAPRFWAQLLAGHAVQASAAAQRRTANNPFGGFVGGPSFYFGDLSPFDLPALQLPSVGLLAGFLLVYVLIVGPVNYLVLRRRRRPDLAWVTIPLLIVIFSAGAYLIGYQSKGGALRLTTATLVQSDPGSPVATVDSFVGVFSPDRTTYDLRFPGDVRLAEVGGNGMVGGPPSSGPPAITEGAPSGVPALHVDTWALRGFLAQTDVAYQPAYTATLTMSGATVSGMVTNQGAAALQDVAVVAGGSVQHLGALAPGQRAAVQLTADQSADLQTLLTALVPGVQVNAYPPPSNPTERARRRRAALLAYLFGARPPQSGDPEVWVVGWGAPAPVEAQIAGESPVRDDLVLVAGRLPVRQAAGRVVLGPAQIPRQVVDGQVSPTAPGAPGAVMDTATFEFHLPANVQVDRLTLDYAEDKGGPPSGMPRLTIYNWRTQTWEEVLDASGNAVTPLGSFQGQLGAPAPYIAQDGAVRVRLEAGGSGGIIVLRRLDLRAEGVRAP